MTEQQITMAVLFIFAVITAYIAKKKNYNPITWFFVGFFLGFIGLFFIILRKNVNDKYNKIDSKIEAKAIKEGNTRGSYDYYLKVSDIKNIWNNTRTIVLKSLEQYDIKTKQNDKDRIYVEVEDSGFVQIVPIKKNNSNYVHVKSYNAGEINFEEISNLLVDSMDDKDETSVKKSKISLRTFSIPIVLLVLAGFSYFYESDEISCDNAVVQDIIKDLTLPELKEEYIISEISKNNPTGRYAYLMAKNMGSENEVKGYSEAKSKADKIFKAPNFSMSSFMTTQKAEKINKVSCSAYVNVNKAQFNIEYNAQPTDDGKEIVVSITSFLE